MKITKNISYLSILFIILFLQCEKETTWVLNESEPVVVVDALITSELKTQKIKIYYSNTGLNQKPVAVSNASVKIEVEEETFTFTESGDSAGLYLSDSVFRAVTGIDYRLIIEYNENFDTATAEMVAVTPLQTYTITEYDSLWRFRYFDDSQPSMTEVYYDWSSDEDYCEEYGACYASETFYTLNNLDIGKSFPPDKQVIIFPPGTKIIRRKYSLSDAHQEFLRSLLLETQWRGGIFDVEQGNVLTNFRNGTLGWFGVCMVLSDTVMFN